MKKPLGGTLIMSLLIFLALWSFYVQRFFAEQFTDALDRMPTVLLYFTGLLILTTGCFLMGRNGVSPELARWSRKTWLGFGLAALGAFLIDTAASLQHALAAVGG